MPTTHKPQSNARPGDIWTKLLSHGCSIIFHTFSSLKQHMDYLTVTVDQESEHSLGVPSAQDLTWLQPRHHPGLCSQRRLSSLLSSHLVSRIHFCSWISTDSLFLQGSRIAALPLLSFYKGLSRLDQTHSESAPFDWIKVAD